MAGTVKGVGGRPAEGSEPPAEQPHSDTVEGIHPDLKAAQARAAVHAAAAAQANKPVAAISAENAWKVQGTEAAESAHDAAAVSSGSLQSAGIGSRSGVAGRLFLGGLIALLLFGGAVWLLMGGEPDAESETPKAEVPGLPAPADITAQTPGEASPEPGPAAEAAGGEATPGTPADTKAAPATRGGEQKARKRSAIVPRGEAKPKHVTPSGSSSDEPSNPVAREGTTSAGSAPPAGATDNSDIAHTPGGPADEDKLPEDMGEVPEERDIVMEMWGNQTRRVIREFYAPRARACFDGRTRNNPDLRGRVVLDVTVKADGYVQAARVARNTTGDEPLGRCLAARVKGWRLPPPPKAPAHVELPFSR